MHLIIGRENLKTMTPTGRKGTNTQCIPKEVYAAVLGKIQIETLNILVLKFDNFLLWLLINDCIISAYVNKKIPEGMDKLEKKKYNKTLTNMCNGLRNPRELRKKSFPKKKNHVQTDIQI